MPFGVAAYYFRIPEIASLKNLARRIFSSPGRNAVSDFVVVAGHADDVAHVVIIVIFVGCEEGIVVVVAFDFDIVIADIGDVVTAGGVIGIFQRNQFDFGVFSIDFRDLLFLGNFGDREVSSKKDRG